MSSLVVIVFLVVVATSSHLGTAVYDPYEPEYLDFLEKVHSLHLEIHSDPDLSDLWKEHVRTWNTRSGDAVMPPPVFECDTSIGDGDDPPTSVHELKPRDIDVVSAFGDSITAGNGLGARNVIEVAFENRGESWTVGGDEFLEANIVTLTNIIRKFNPDVKGYSRCMSTGDSDRSWLNVARPGGTNRNMPGQADTLIFKLKNDTRIDMDNDWKLTTLFVGGNDLCASCRRWDRYSPQVYRANIEEALDKLHAEVPRMLVNLVVMFDVTVLPDFSDGLLCDLLQWGFCDCARNETTVGDLRETQMGYYNELYDLVSSGKYDTREDFTVVLQPHMRDMLPPVDPDTGEWVREFLSYDCFHPSRLAHQSMTYFLWDTMLIPVPHKPYATDEGLDNSEVTCPTEDLPYIFTSKNSDVEWPPENMAQRRHRASPKRPKGASPKDPTHRNKARTEKTMKRMKKKKRQQ